jgi:predicted tellurium resistance membrane protein TerC
MFSNLLMPFAPSDWLTLFTLTGLEVVLGIDNVIFIALLVEHLTPKDRIKARFIGLSLALLLRVVLLFGATWVIGLTKPLFHLFEMPFSGRSLLLIIGGLFLIIKSALEVVSLFKEAGIKEKRPSASVEKKRFRNVIIQIIFVDLILSFDSIITAVGITNHLLVIIIAIFIAIAVMLLSAAPISDFIYKNPSIKVLALAFILLVGVFLVAQGFGYEIEKGYLYVAMLFCLMVETTNLLLKKQQIKNNHSSRAAS